MPPVEPPGLPPPPLALSVGELELLKDEGERMLDDDESLVSPLRAQAALLAANTATDAVTTNRYMTLFMASFPGSLRGAVPLIERGAGGDGRNGCATQAARLKAENPNEVAWLASGQVFSFTRRLGSGG